MVCRFECDQNIYHHFQTLSHQFPIYFEFSLLLGPSCFSGLNYQLKYRFFYNLSSSHLKFRCGIDFQVNYFQFFVIKYLRFPLKKLFLTRHFTFHLAIHQNFLIENFLKFDYLIQNLIDFGILSFQLFFKLQMMVK